MSVACACREHSPTFLSRQIIRTSRLYARWSPMRGWEGGASNLSSLVSCLPCRRLVAANLWRLIFVHANELFFLCPILEMCGKFARAVLQNTSVSSWLFALPIQCGMTQWHHLPRLVIPPVPKLQILDFHISMRKHSSHTILNARALEYQQTPPMPDSAHPEGTR